MRRNIITLCMMTLIMLIAFITGCSMDLFGTENAHSLELSTSEITTDLAENKTFTVTATTKNQSGTIRTNTSIVWTFSSPEKVSVIHQSGSQISFSVIESGKFVLTAYDQTNSALTQAVIITATGALKAIYISENTLTLSQKEEHALSISFNPSEPSAKDVVWTSSNTEVAQVAKTGETEAKVIAGIPGTATITVSSTSNSSIQATCRVTVSEIEIEPTEPRYMRLSSSYLTFTTTTGTENLTATVYDGTNSVRSDVVVLWESSDTSIATVQQAGSTVTVTPRGIGSATITAYVDGYESIKGTCDIFIGKALQELVITKVDTDSQPKSRALTSVPDPQLSGTYPIGQTITYKVSYIPEDTSQTGISWASTEDIVSISPDSEYVTVTTNSSGSTYLVATSTANTDIKASASIAVYDQTVEPDNNISRIVLDPYTATLTAGGESTTIKATVYDQKDNEMSTDLVWSTDNSYAELNDLSVNGTLMEVIPLSAGITDITATSLANPYVSAKASVYIRAEGETEEATAPEKIIPSAEQMTLVKGASAMIEISYLPVSPSSDTIAWNTGNSAVATVEGNGTSAKITAIAAGTATITVSSAAVTAPATIIVRVVNPEDVVARVSSISLSDSSLTLDPPFSTDQTGLTAVSYDSSGNTLDDTYTWTVSNSSIISGRSYNNSTQFILTPLIPGTVTITARSVSNPSITASAVVTAAGGITAIKLSPANLSVAKGESVYVDATLVPSDTVQDGITWALSGSAASMTQDNTNPYRVIIKGVSTGTATLKATSTGNTAISVTCPITVLDGSGSTTAKVGSIELSSTTLSIAPPITTPAILTATVYDVDGLVYPIGVTWEVEDETIAELSTTDEERVSVIAKKAGETRIVARSITDPSITRTCILTVSGKITSIVPEETFVTIVNGESTELKVTLNPSDTIETELIWETEGSTDGSTTETPWVTLRPTSSGCLITAIKTGETTVTVRSKVRPDVKAEIAVLVTEAPLAQATITISPTPIELSPSSTRVKVTATVKPTGESVINEDVVFRIDPASLVDTTVGGTNEIYLIPNGTAGEGTVYAYLPSYPHIEEGKARLFVGGQLRSLAANGTQSVAVNVGETASISVAYNPENTTETGIIWTSSNTTVARVDGGNATDAIVTGVSSGVATVTATSKYYDDVKVEFTIVVKSIINEVAFIDQFDNRGNIFYTDTETPLTLNCYISPDIERKLVFKPKTNTYTMATLAGIDGTINDQLFTPDPSAAGTYEYNITYDSKVVGTLTINTVFKGLSLNTTREVFEGDYTTAQLRITADSGEVSYDQIKFKSSDTSVATVDDQGLIKAVSPGEATITSEIGSGGMKLETKVYVNVDIPESFEAALRATGYLASSGDTVLPSNLDRITTLDLRSTPSTIAVDLSGIKKLNNLKTLNVSGIKLSSDVLDLYNSPYLTTVYADNAGLMEIRNVPKGLETISAQNNLISSYGALSSSDVRSVNLANNQITSYTNLKYASYVNLSVNKLTSINVSSETLERLILSGNNIATVSKIDSRSLKELHLDSNNLWYSSISLTSNKQLNTPNLEILNLNNNKLGLYRDKACPSCNGATQGANETTYWESESQNREQPLMLVNIEWMPKLREIHLMNNHIRSGLNAYDKAVRFRIYSPALQRVEIRGNNIGNYYSFQNSNGEVTWLPSSSSYNINGMTINYDRGGCFYTSRSWYDYWTWFLSHRTGWNYGISWAFIY